MIVGWRMKPLKLTIKDIVRGCVLRSICGRNSVSFKNCCEV